MVAYVVSGALIAAGIAGVLHQRRRDRSAVPTPESAARRRKAQDDRMRTVDMTGVLLATMIGILGMLGVLQGQWLFADIMVVLLAGTVGINYLSQRFRDPAHSLITQHLDVDKVSQSGVPIWLGPFHRCSTARRAVALRCGDGSLERART